MKPDDYSFIRYLSAKKSVDDRSLNRHVWDTLKRLLDARDPRSPLTVLELGTGIGTMVERMLSWGLFAEAEITALDVDPILIAHAVQRIGEWASQQRYDVERTNHQLELRKNGKVVQADFRVVDALDFVDQQSDARQWDLLVANAFLDLIDLQTALPRIFQLCKPGGLFYFTINFDGATIFEPEWNANLDAWLHNLYHQTMDERLIKGRRSGDSRTGRHLYRWLKAAGAQPVDIGSSDWVVFPIDGAYPQDEAFFLHFIVDTFYQALAERDEVRLKGAALEDWTQTRRAQINRAELLYFAHQLDYTGIYQPTPP